MAEEDQGLSIPRGGPIYVPNMIGPLSRVLDFQTAFLEELQDLEAAVCLTSSPISFDEEILVDDLKVFTDEELTDMAMKEAFKDGDNTEKNTAQTSISHSDSRTGETHYDTSHKSTHLESCEGGGDDPTLIESSNGLPSEESRYATRSKIKLRKNVRRTENEKESADNDANLESCEGGSDAPVLFESSNGHASENNCNGGMSKKKPVKKKRKTDSCGTNDDYLVKVEQLAKIKQKQDEDRANVRLHCLQCKINESANPLSERNERLITLRATNNATKLVKPTTIPGNRDSIYPKVVLCVEVYHNVRKWLKTQEFLVLGQQPLTELRDKICCSTDQMMKKAEQHDPSGYFLIEDVFCNDMRDPSAIDYSKPIFDWLRNSKDEALRKWDCILTGELKQKQKAVLGEIQTSELPRFRSVDMHNIRFSDLRFRLGAGYLYCHQGDCKHTVVIRDMRMLHPEDIQDRTVYPVSLFQLKPRIRKCSVCNIYRATKVAVDDKWAKVNPCYFCDYCYTLLHPENEPVLQSDGIVYDYLHD